jgi:hypothetical protein
LDLDPYSGPNTLGLILAATGDCARFKNYRQYVAHTGYFAGLEKSQTIDRTHMSHRGNRKLAEGHPWYKAMPFACAALARHVYHCLKYQEPYQLEKAFEAMDAHLSQDQVL